MVHKALADQFFLFSVIFLDSVSDDNHSVKLGDLQETSPLQITFVIVGNVLKTVGGDMKSMILDRCLCTNV